MLDALPRLMVSAFVACLRNDLKNHCKLATSLHPSTEPVWIHIPDALVAAVLVAMLFVPLGGLDTNPKRLPYFAHAVIANVKAKRNSNSFGCYGRG